MPGNIANFMRRAGGKSKSSAPPMSSMFTDTPALSVEPRHFPAAPIAHNHRRNVRPDEMTKTNQFNSWLTKADPETKMRMMLRYGRLAELFQSATAVGESRIERYREYDVMAESSLMSSYLEMVTDDACQQSHENGRTLWANADSPYANEIDDFLDSIENENLVWGWMYQLAKHGDWFIRPDVTSRGVEAIRDDYHPSEVWRIDVNGELLGFAFQENVFSSNATYAYGVGVQPASIVGPTDFVHFILNYKPHFDKIRIKLPVDLMHADDDDENDEDKDDDWYQGLKSHFTRIQKKQTRTLMEAATSEDIPESIREEAVELLEWAGLDFQDPDKSDPDFVYAVITARYGSSMMHNARKDYKILNLVEQSLALARLSRSPVARVFYVDTSGANVIEREEMIEYVERKFTMSESFDADNDLYKDSYTPLGWLDDVVLPYTGDKGDVRVEQIGGDVDVHSIVDIDHFLAKVFSAIRVPKSFMGYDEALPGFSGAKSLTALDMRYARSAKKLQRSYIAGMQQLIRIHLEAKYDKEIKLSDIPLEMVSISSAEEQERVEIMTERIGLIQQVAALIEEAGGNESLAIKDMLRDSAAEMSLIEMKDEWFIPSVTPVDAEAGGMGTGGDFGPGPGGGKLGSGGKFPGNEPGFDDDLPSGGPDSLETGDFGGLNVDMAGPEDSIAEPSMP